MDTSRLYAVAMDLLRRQVADLKQSFIANATRGAAPPAAAPAIDPATGQFVKPGAAGGGGAAPGSTWEKVLAAVTGILGEVRKGKAGATLRTHFNRLRKAFDRARKTRGGRLAAAGVVGGALGVLGGRAAGRLARKGAGAVKGGAAALVGLLGPLLSPLGAILSPMKLLADVIGSNVSGFQLVGTAVKLLAATLAPVLLPVFVAVATGLTELSDRIWEDIEPGLEDFYDLVMGSLLPAVSAIVQAFVDAAAILDDPDAAFEGTAVGDAAGFLNRNLFGAEDRRGREVRTDDEPEPGRGGRRGDSGAGDFSGDTGAGGDFDDAGGLPSRGPGGPAVVRPATGDDGVSGRTRGAMGDVLRELRMSVGAKASFGDIAGRSKEITLAGLNQSPFEAKMLERFDKAVGALERVAGNTEPRRSPRYGGAGDFSGGTGTGTSGGDF